MDATNLSNDELIDRVTTWAARVARGEAELLDLIAELDAREAWAVHGVTSCAAWLSWQLGWCDNTARERVRVARALRTLPLIREELAQGCLSFSQVRAVTRMATPETEQTWLDLARHCTGAQLDKIARGADRARAADTPAAERELKQAARVEWDQDGDLLLTLRIPAHQALPVLAVLEQYQGAEQTERDAAVQQLLAEVLDTGASAEAGDPDVPQGASAEASAPTVCAGAASSSASAEAPNLQDPAVARGRDPLEPYPYVEPDYPVGPDRLGRGQTEAERAAITAWSAERTRLRSIRDAWNTRREQLLLEASARRVPTGQATLADGLFRALTCPVDGPKTTVRLMVDPLSGWARTQHDELLPPATVQGLLRALPGQRGPRPGAVLDLCRYDQARRTRQISPALRRLLGAVDGERCRFPGCSHTRFLHAHHVMFWRDGGNTDLGNLVLLCTKHHRLLHREGYALVLTPDRMLHVSGPDGTRLEYHPALPDASAEALPPAQPNTLRAGYLGDHFNLGYAATVMLAHAA